MTRRPRPDMTSLGEAGGSPAGPRAGGFQTGELLAQGRYRVGRELNRGGAAVVYEGLDLQAAPPAAVALKCHDLRHAERQALERLKREILYAKEMAHANVVRLLNVFVDNECLVLVLELVRCSDLLEVRSRPLGFGWPGKGRGRGGDGWAVAARPSGQGVCVCVCI